MASTAITSGEEIMDKLATAPIPPVTNLCSEIDPSPSVRAHDEVFEQDPMTLEEAVCVIKDGVELLDCVDEIYFEADTGVMRIETDTGTLKVLVSLEPQIVTPFPGEATSSNEDVLEAVNRIDNLAFQRENNAVVTLSLADAKALRTVGNAARAAVPDLESRKLEDEFGGHWGKHPDYPPSDWRHEVENNETRLGYWEWVAGKVSQAEFDNDGSSEAAAERSAA